MSKREGASDGKLVPVLTPRELAVLELLQRGLSDREIGTSLYISPSTAGVHVSNIARKLGVKNRAEVAARRIARAAVRPLSRSGCCPAH